MDRIIYNHVEDGMKEVEHLFVEGSECPEKGIAQLIKKWFLSSLR